MFKTLISKIPSKFVYAVSRTGLYILVNIFAVVMSVLLTSLLSTILAIIFDGRSNYLILQVVPRINGMMSISIISTLIVLIMMTLVFNDDGKKHAAYEKHNMCNCTATVLLMFALYALPVFLMHYVKNAMLISLQIFYKPSYWVSKLMNIDLEIAVVISAAMLSLICMFFYKLSGYRYFKKINKFQQQNSNTI